MGILTIKILGQMVGLQIQGWCKYLLGHCAGGTMHFAGDKLAWVASSWLSYD